MNGCVRELESRKVRGGAMKRALTVLLVRVMLSSIVSPAMGKQTKTVITPDTKNLSPNDLIDPKEIYKYLQNTSEEEIRKK